MGLTTSKATRQVASRRGIQNAWDTTRAASPQHSPEYTSLATVNSTNLMSNIENGFGGSLLMSALNTTNEGMIVSDGNGTILLANTAIQRMFGWSMQELINNKVTILMPRRFSSVHDVYMHTFTREGKPKVMGKLRQLHALRKDGSEFPVEVTLTDMAVHRQLLIVAMIRDITEIIKARNLELAEKLIENMLPASVAQRIQASQDDERQLIADHHKSATVMFCDIVGFTTFSTLVKPEFLVKLLNDLFKEFDEATAKFSIEKIKTIGDCYMCAAGVPQPDKLHALHMIEFALETKRLVKRFNEVNQTTIQMRWGINSGPLIAGVIGHKKLVYDLWGDSVNIASRMESTGRPNRIHVSASTMELVRSHFSFEERGPINIKGVGQMRTYFLMEDDDYEEYSLPDTVLSSDSQMSPLSISTSNSYNSFSPISGSNILSIPNV